MVYSLKKKKNTFLSGKTLSDSGGVYTYKSRKTRKNSQTRGSEGYGTPFLVLSFSFFEIFIFPPFFSSKFFFFFLFLWGGFEPGRWAIFPLVQFLFFPSSPSTSFTCCAAESVKTRELLASNIRTKRERERGAWSTWQIASLNRGVNHRGAHTLTQWRAYTHTHTHRERKPLLLLLPPPPPFFLFFPNGTRRRQSNIRFFWTNALLLYTQRILAVAHTSPSPFLFLFFF